jgi:hypothetical protein
VQHVAVCQRCAARYAAVSAHLDAAAQSSYDAADEAFTQERLLSQRERILRRIENHGARVLPFPAAERSHGIPHPSTPMLKWVAAAAAAGLFLGLSAGRILNLGTGNPPAQVARSVAAPRLSPAAGGGQVVSATLNGADAGDAFLSAVDMALSAPSIPELAAIDALTLDDREAPPRIKD